MTQRLLNRRQFGRCCAAFGLCLPALSAAAEGGEPASASAIAGAGTASRTATRTVKFADGTVVSALGQGGWHLGQGRHPQAVEVQALRTGISHGMTLIDTSGNYGDGRSEQLIGQALAGLRDRVFLVSKVEADDAARNNIARACEASLRRLGTDHLDLYLLHSPLDSQYFPGVVTAFEALRTAGKIRAWGVSNFSVAEMNDLFRVPNAQRCATNQVPYSLNSRHIEKDLLAWCRQHNMPVMAYSPLGGDHALVLGDSTLARIAAAHRCSPAAVALAWVIRSGNVIAIPESGSPAHVEENALALSIALTQPDLQALDSAFPGPTQGIRGLLHRLSI